MRRVGPESFHVVERPLPGLEEMRHQIDGFSDLAYCLLGLPEEYAPDADCLREGVSMFHQRHRSLLRNNSTLRAVTALVARLLRERLDSYGIPQAQ